MLAVLRGTPMCAQERTFALVLRFYLCVFVIFIYFFPPLRFINFPFKVVRRRRDNGLGPGWTDDECVHFVTTKA